MIPIRQYVLEFKANRNPVKSPDPKPGQKYILKSDLSAYPTDKNKNPVISGFTIDKHMQEFLGRWMTISERGRFPGAANVEHIRFEGCPYYWPLEIVE